MRVVISLVPHLTPDEVQRLTKAAQTNCRCAKFVECQPNAMREGCLRFARAEARRRLIEAGYSEWQQE